MSGFAIFSPSCSFRLRSGWVGLVAVLVAQVIALSAGPAPAWSSRIWQADDGLPDNRIAGLVQRPNGELWVATRGGLARFTGSKFEVFQLDAVRGVTGNGARAMFGDSRGRFWVGAYRDLLVCISPSGAQLFGPTEGIPAGQLNDMAEAEDGTIWLVIGNHVGWMAQGRFNELELPAINGPAPHPALARDGAGRVWCFANGQMGVADAARFTVKASVAQRQAAIGRARAGGIWMCADAKLSRVDDNGGVTSCLDLPVDARPMCILEDRTGAVWIGTVAHGLFRCADGQVERIELAAPQVGQLLEDQEGSIWAGTYGGGLHRLQSRVIDVISVQAGLPTPSMVSVCQDTNGVYWAASATGHLVRGDGVHWSAVPLGPLWNGAPASCVVAGSNGKLWVGTRGQGLFEIDQRAGTSRNWTTADGLLSNSLRGLFCAADGSLWFTGNTPTSFGCIKGDVLHQLPVPATARNIRAIVQDARGAIWVGTSDGQVLREENGQLVSEPGLAHMNTSSVRALHTTSDGSLWIGYADKGLGLYRDGRLTLITTAQGLEENTVWQIVGDRKGALWLAGARGLYRIPLSAALNLRENPRERLRPVLYRRAEGLPNPQPHYDNTPAVCSGSNGTILFSTGLGLLALYPEVLHDNDVPPRVLLERVSVDERVAALHDLHFPLRQNTEPEEIDTASVLSRLRLPPEHRRVTFDFSALSYKAPENVRYRYRLEGADEAWSEPTAERTAHYSRLPAGDYRFRVVASNDAGVWAQTGATLAVTVGPFYWQSWWFRVSALAGFTGFVTAVVRLVSFRRLQAKLRAVEQEKALLQERTRIARDIHDDLGGSLTHIKLLSELAVQGPGIPEHSEGHIRQITRTTQDVMKSLD